jgi:hypothetical protein
MVCPVEAARKACKAERASIGMTAMARMHSCTPGSWLQ